MYTISWWNEAPTENPSKKVQYLADVAEVVRDAFGCENAVYVTITKED